MPHPSEHASPGRSLGAEEAQQLTETLKALASPSRPVSYTHLTLPTTPYV